MDSPRKELEKVLNQIGELAKTKALDFPHSRNDLIAYFGSISSVKRVLNSGDLPYYRMSDNRIIVMNSDLQEYMSARLVDWKKGDHKKEAA